MNLKLQANQLIQRLINEPWLLKKVLPTDPSIKTLGVYLGGSRILDLEIKESDYDLIIVVSYEDYLKITKTDLYRSIEIDNNHIHCYFTPVDPLQSLEDLKKSFFGLDWNLSLMMRKLSLDDFFIIKNEDEIKKYIKKINSKVTLKKFKEAYCTLELGLPFLKKMVEENAYCKYLDARCYYFLYIGSILWGKLETQRTRILNIRKLLELKEPGTIKYSKHTAYFIKKTIDLSIEWLEKDLKK